jgi:hypothetical protein
VRAPPSPTGFRAPLAVREYRILFGAYVTSLLGDVVAAVALTILIYARTGSSLLAALTFAVAFAPHLLAGLFLSALVDRAPPRRLMVACDVASAVLIALTTVPGIPVAGLLGLLLLASLLSPISGGARAGLIAEILPPPAFVAGRSLFRIVAQSAQVVGNAAGGLLVVAISARGALAVDAASFVLSAIVVRLGTPARPARTPDRATSLTRDSLRGIRTVLAQARLRSILLLGWAVAACSSAPEALAAPYVAGIGASPGLVGVWLMALPAGVIAGELVGIWVLSARWQRRLVGPLAGAVSLPLLAFAAHPGLPLALALLLVSGAGGVFFLGLDRALYEATDPALRARALTVSSTGLMTVQGLGFVAFGALGELVPAHVAIAVAGGIGLAAVVCLRPRTPVPAA